MHKDLSRTVEIVDGAQVVISGNEFSVKGNGKEIKKSFDIGKIKAEVKGNQILLNAKNATKREAKMIGTIWAHLKNMIKGTAEGFSYELEICNVHFPMNVKDEGNKVIIKSFLGETTIREARVLDGVKVDISGNKIVLTSHDIEAAGQTAANLEKATRLSGRDRRIFQDGIFITKKPYRII